MVNGCYLFRHGKIPPIKVQVSKKILFSALTSLLDKQLIKMTDNTLNNFNTFSVSDIKKLIYFSI